MGKKSGPQAPAAPDPYKTADAQAGANRDAAITQQQLNNMNQYTPQGSITYNQSGTWADGTPRFEQTFEYSPEQKALYDQQNQIAQALGGLAQDNIGRVADAQSKTFNFDGMTPLSTVGGGTNAQTGFGGYGGVQTTYGNGGDITKQVADAGDIQKNLDYSGLEALQPGSSFDATSKAAADAMYQQAASRLDPQYQQLENDMRNRLVNSGISENSEAFKREMDNFARSRTDAYNQANYSSIGAGLAAQQQGYNQSLSTRQQGVSEINNQGAFANAAQGQQYGQNLSDAQFANDAQGQQNSQNMQSAAFGNAAQDQQFTQGMAKAGFNNSAIQQNFQNDMAKAGFNNSVRQQEIEEAAYLRNLPLNDIAALLGTGGGVQDPNFQPFAQAGVAAPDLQGAIYQNYNAQMQQYNQAQANRSQGLGSIFGALGSLGAAAIPVISDRRLKHSIQRIGTLASGLATYVFSYINETKRHFGVMAQEALDVVPDAVGQLPNGVMYVDYRKVW